MLLDAVDIRWHVVHNNVQLGLLSFLVFLFLFFSLSSLGLFVQLDEVRVTHPYNVLMVKLFMNLKLAAFILFVLLDFLDSYDLACRFKGAHEDLGESALATLDFFGEFVGLLSRREIEISDQMSVTLKNKRLTGKTLGLGNR